MKILVAHPGTQYSHQLVRQLEEQGLLYKYITCFCITSDSLLGKLSLFIPDFIFRKISNRFIKGVPKSKVVIYPILELITQLKIKLGGNSEAALFERNRRFQDKISEKVLCEADIVVGFDTSSWILVQRCKKLGKRFILDVSIAHPLSKQRIFERILLKYPDWSFTLQIKEDIHILKEQLEMELASNIVVASTFTMNTLVDNGIPNAKIFINPYGVDSNSFKPLNIKNRKPIKFLFLGIVDARKGVPFLLEVWNSIEIADATLTLIGPILEKTRTYIERHYKNIEIFGAVSFHDLKGILPTYDVLVFPSFFEGFGLVIPEAMACGMPVITTNATCAHDIFQNQIEGIIIDSGSNEMLKDAILFFIQNPEKIGEMGLMARKKVEQLTWEVYGKRWNMLFRNDLPLVSNEGVKVD